MLRGSLSRASCGSGTSILTHCTDGLGAPEQIALLKGLGVQPGHVTLSHTDKVVDRGYHREILATGASVEYDQGFRWKPDVDNGTLTLLVWMIEDGFGDQLMLGIDAARQGYWTTYGGSPGWAFLLVGLVLGFLARSALQFVRGRRPKQQIFG